MTNIIDCVAISNQILNDIKTKIIDNSFIITLAIIIVDDKKSSKAFIMNKVRAADKIGINHYVLCFNYIPSEKRLLTVIDELNNDPKINGIIIQLPLPNGFNQNTLLAAISIDKDVDGLTPFNAGLLSHKIHKFPYCNYIRFIPCTAQACLSAIKSCCNNLIGKNVVIVNRSILVGKPLAQLLLNEDCTVTICHSKTINLASITSIADIIVVAIGQPQYFTYEYFNTNAIIIDVGCNRMIDNKFVGDIDFDNVNQCVKYITPVPNGIGPLTVAYLMKNTYKAYKRQSGNSSQMINDQIDFDGGLNMLDEFA